MEMHFDEKKNRIIIETDEGTEVEIPPQKIRDLLPVISEEEKIKELQMVLHHIEMEQLTKMEDYINRMAKIAKDMDEARKDLKKCNDMTCVKKWAAVIKSFVDKKNTLAEIRRSVGLLEKTKKEIRTRIAKLETGHN